MRASWSCLVALLLVSWAACAPGTEDEPKPELRIASDATFAPFHFLDDAGEPTGLDIELARRVAERAGFEPVVMVLPYEDLLAGLSSGSHDLVAATTGVTAERQQSYLFTTPYFETCQAALVRIGDGEPTSLASLEGRRVGTAGAGTSALAIRNIPGAEHVQLDKGQASVPALEEGLIDALIVDEFDAVEAARESEGRLAVLEEPVALERYAFVLPKERADLKEKLDRALATLEKVGMVRELRKRFGVERDVDWPVAIGK